MTGTLREQITEALIARLAPQAGTGNGVSYATTASPADLADVTLVVVSPELDGRDDEIARLRERWGSSRLHCHHLIDRAERAEAEVARLAADLAAMQTKAAAWAEAYGRAEADRARLREQPEPGPGKCARCYGLRQVPDWSNWNHEYGEPRPKPCPDCTHEDPPTETPDV